MKSYVITADSLAISVLIVQNIAVNQEKCKVAMTEDLFATERVYDLVKTGIPFRDTYKQFVNGLTEKND